MAETPDIHTIKVLQYNVEGKRNNMAELLRDPKTWKYDILAIQEPFINKHGATKQTHNPIKHLFREYIPNHKMARVATFINKSIPAADIELSDHGPNLTRVTLKNQGDDKHHQITIFNVYNPNPEPPYDTVLGLPKRSPLPRLNTELRRTQQHSNLVVGDFNLRNELWGGPGIGEEKCPRAAAYLIEILERHGLNLCFEPGTKTRPARGLAREDSTIDLAFATEDICETLIYSGLEMRLDKGSDHRPLSTTFGYQLRTRTATEERYLLKKTNVETFQATLKTLLPEIPQAGLSIEDIDRLTACIQHALSKAIEESTPKARMGPRSNPGWTRECTVAIREFKKARRRYRKYNTEETFIEFQLARRHKKRTIDKTLRDEHRDRISEIKNMEQVWKIAKWAKNRGIPRTTFTPAIKDREGNPQNTTQNKADALRNSFFPIPPPADTSDIDNATYQPPMAAPDIAEHETLQAIKRTGPWKAPGPDQIPNKVLHMAASQLAAPLTNLFNNCLKNGYYPKPLRESITVALRKPGKGDYTQPKSYRPVALLNTIGKLLESIIATRLAHLAESHQLLPKFHMGGRATSSCEHAIHLLLERLYWARRHRLTATLLLMDVAGAYDNVKHERLIHNLRERRIPKEWVLLLESFLTGRRTKIRLPEGDSSWIDTPNGIPQGSPLSPILYLFYNAPILEVDLEGDGLTVGYIDDTGILIHGNSTEENNRRLDRIHQRMEQWAESAASVFAPSKYHVIHFTPDQTNEEESLRPLTLHLRDGGTQIVEASTEERYLGVIIDNKLTSAAHLRHIEERARTQLQAISQLAGSTWGISTQQLRRVYIATVLPQITYAASCWYTPDGGYGYETQRKETIKTVTDIQKRAACHISGAFRTTAAAALDAELHLPPTWITLQRQCEAGLHRIASSQHYRSIQQTRATAHRDNTSDGRKPRIQNRRLSPLQKLEAAHKKRYPDTPTREHIRAGLFPPWERPPTVTIPPTNLGETAHRSTLEYARKERDHMCIYTDGSEIEGKVGAAAYSINDSTYETRSLGSNKTANVYAGELVGITLAMDMALRKHQEKPTARDRPRKVTIFSDSRAGLQAVERPGNRSGQAIIWGIRIRLRIANRLGISVQFQWVPAHIGILGNERADKLAKLATGWRDEKGRTQPAPSWENNTQLTSAANRTEKELAKHAWQKYWSKGDTGQTLRELLPTVNKKSLDIYKGIPKALCSVLVQARTGKIALKAYLHAINRADNNKCTCGAVQTVKHVLLTCPNLEELREQVWESRTSRPTCAKTMLSTPAEAQKSAKFLIKTGLLGQFAGARDKIEW